MKRLLQILSLLTGVFLLWYFIIKPNDYNVSFKAKTSNGHVYDELRNWSAIADMPSEINILKQDPYRSLTQDITFRDKEYRISWTVYKLNDSISRVKAGINEPGKSFLNRLSIPFGDTSYEEESLELVLNFKDFLDESIKQFKIKVEGKSSFTTKFCACTNARTTPEKKAFQMMRDYSYLSGFIASGKLKPDGNPLIQVLDFDEKSRLIEFDFCFPVKRQDSLPESPDIFFREVEQTPAIKAIYNGDYRFSNKAWYRMFEYAEDHEIPFEKKPLEVYYNNPNMGGDALKWTTEIYLPIKS